MTTIQLAELTSKIKANLTADEQTLLLNMLAQGHHIDDTGTVRLGDQSLADAQRQADEAAGGFAALVCGDGKGR